MTGWDGLIQLHKVTLYSSVYMVLRFNRNLTQASVGKWRSWNDFFSRCSTKCVHVLPTWDVKKAREEEYDDVMLSRMAAEANATFIRETLLRPWPPTRPTNRFRETVTVHEMNDITWLKETGVLIYDILGYGLP